MKKNTNSANTNSKSILIIKLIYLVLLTPTIIFAQVSWYPVYNLSNTPSATSDYHSVDSDYNGNYHVAWGDNGVIKYKYSSDMGVTWRPNITVFSSSNICGYPVVKCDFNYVYLAFHQLVGDYEIIFMVSDDFGQTWYNSGAISGMDSGSLTPQISSFMENVYVVWEQKIDMINNKSEIVFVKSTDRGLTWQLTPQNLSNTPNSHSRWVQLESFGDIVYCAWLESEVYPASDIYFSKSTDAGATWTAPVNLTNDSRPQNRIFMDISYYNDVYIASDDIITFNFDEIYLLKSTDSGLSWSTPQNITNNIGHSNTPCIEVIGDYVYFTWSDNSNSAPAFDNSEIYFKWSSDKGITWQDSINISNNADISSRPRICFSYDGPIENPWMDMTLVWYDYSLGDSEILARRGQHFYLPVELTAFNAIVNQNNVNLIWQTATEINNSGFNIERVEITAESENPLWENIAFVPGFGTTTEPKSYSFTDKKLSAGTYQYRLKQMDYDGTFEYSEIIEISITTPQAFNLYQNYPNPFNPSTTISYDLLSDDFVTLKIYDVLGNEITTLINEEQPAGYHKINFNASTLSSGMYFYSLQSNNKILTNKMVLIK